MDCSCAACKSACTNKPGWFLPDQIWDVAKFLGLSVKQTFERYLMVDYIGADANFDHDVFILSPAITSELPGQEFPIDPRGTCVFFKEGSCSIHAVKPFECRAYDHNTTEEEGRNRHAVEIPRAWDDPAVQESVAKLLGRQPEIPEPDEATLLHLLLGR